MSEWTEFKEAMSAKANSPKGMAAIATIDAIILIVFGFVNWSMGKEVTGWGVPLTATVWFLVAVVISLSGYYLFRKSMIGIYLGWIAAIAAIALGIVFTFNLVENNNIWGEIYLLLTGIINVIILLIPSTREGLQ